VWTNLIAVVVSVSGLRQWLDPDSPNNIPALAWIEGSLRWGAATCIPVLLFASGVWVYGKSILNPNTLKQVGMRHLIRRAILRDWKCPQLQLDDQISTLATPFVELRLLTDRTELPQTYAR
jgi:hypothetical protein